MKALIIAAGRGSRIKGLTKGSPKCLLDLNGKKIIDRIIEPLLSQGIKEIYIVVGYQKQKIIDYVSKKYKSVKFIYNPDWKTKGNGVSVYKAKKALGGDEFILLMSDHIFHTGALKYLMKKKIKEKEACLLTDKKTSDVFDIDDATKVYIKRGKIMRIHKELKDYNAVDCGMFKCNGYLFKALSSAIRKGDESLSGGINEIIKKGVMKSCDIKNYFWQDIDHPDGYKNALRFV